MSSDDGSARGADQMGLGQGLGGWGGGLQGHPAGENKPPCAELCQSSDNQSPLPHISSCSLFHPITFYLGPRVPQCSIWGPLLFTIFINSIGCNLTESLTHLYTDDDVLCASAPSANQAILKLQQDFNGIQNTFKNLKLLLNAHKTKGSRIPLCILSHWAAVGADHHPKQHTAALQLATVTQHSL
uniref:Reverse transcriptase domain-containing protein n=1 Tax=Periophthalmus magnuspinnatus TaxID=409849 RepID=A0A3B4BF37_9GOBI